jgi:hypothetical protein
MNPKPDEPVDHEERHAVEKEGHGVHGLFGHQQQN